MAISSSYRAVRREPFFDDFDWWLTSVHWLRLLQKRDSPAQPAHCEREGRSIGWCDDVLPVKLLSFRSPQWVDDFDAVEILFIIGYDGAFVGLRDSRDDGVERATRPTFCFPIRH